VRVRVEVTTSVPAAVLRIGVALATATPALAVRLAGVHLAPVPAMLIFGTAVLASVALLLWAAEAARVDMTGSLALSLLALVTVLPEYAIDIYFAFAAGADPAYAAYTTANMTGANRLLIGAAWPLLVFAAIWAVRRRGRPGDTDQVRLRPHRRIEIALVPKEKKLAELTDATLTVDPASKRVVAIFYHDREGNLTRFEITGYQDLSRQGSFSPPSNVRWVEGSP
jgi:hypothetical protein